MATPPNPMMMALMQRLAGQAQGPGGPGGPPNPALLGARQAAQTPFGNEQGDIKSMQAQVGTWVTRYLQRAPDVAQILLKIYQDFGKALEKIAQLPAQPVQAPPPGLPMAGGAAMMPPSGDMSPAG